MQGREQFTPGGALGEARGRPGWAHRGGAE